MKALSFRQPWGWAVAHAGKRIENRKWGVLRRGVAGLAKVPMGGVFPGEVFAVHVSASDPTPFDIDGVKRATGLATLPAEAFLKSSLIALCACIDVVRPQDEIGDVERITTRFESKQELADQLEHWWLGPYALVLTKALPFEPITDVSGKLYFWDILDKDLQELQRRVAPTQQIFLA